MLRYASPQCTPARTLTSRSSSTSNSSMESNEPTKRKSLTPQRKHHKLLKDGSEVWSQEVEQIFVDGLRKYWESPWATYSRGRSRWRNQFMVDHLKKHGIERSKKQVASHIQVLRNMWRGEPEFHLVAGGEELFQENGLLASPKSTEGTASPEASPPAHLDSPDWRSSWSSSASSAPDFSSFPMNFGASTSAQRLSPPIGTHSMPVRRSDPALPSFASGADYRTVTPASIARPRSSSTNLEPLALGPALFNLPPTTMPDTPDFMFMPQTSPPPNRLANISLWTDSSPMCLIDIDKLTSASAAAAPLPGQRPPPFRILLRLHLKCPASDVQSALTFQGFHAMVSFAMPWASSAKCHTKTWAGKTCTSHEVGLLEQLNPQQPQAVLPAGDVPSSMPIAHLPQSALSRCRWLEPMAQTISQQIVVDREVLAVILYTIDRSAAAADVPTVELVGFHKYPWRSAANVQPLASPPVSPVTSFAFPGYGGPPTPPASQRQVRPPPPPPPPPAPPHVPGTGGDFALPSGMDFSHTTAARGPNTGSRNMQKFY